MCTSCGKRYKPAQSPSNAKAGVARATPVRGYDIRKQRIKSRGQKSVATPPEVVEPDEPK